MSIISEDNIIQIKLKMVVWIAGVIIIVFSTLFGWQEIQIDNLKNDVINLESITNGDIDNLETDIKIMLKELEKEKVDVNNTKIILIEKNDLPGLLQLLSIQQSQLNTLNIITFGRAIEVNIGGKYTSPALPKRNN
jgi:hypothetical protein